MTYNDTWSGDSGNNPQCGWYTYDLVNGQFIQHTNDDVVMRAGFGGTYLDGQYYGFESATDSWLFPDPRFNVFNGTNFKLLHTTSYGRSDRDHAVVDMAANPIDHQIYAVAQHSNGNTADGGWLQRYDPSTGEMTRVAHLPRFQNGIAINRAGTIYTLDESGTLSTLALPAGAMEQGSEKNATLTTVGHLGYRLQGDVNYANSLTFDLRTERLYLSGSVYPTDNYEGTDVLLRGLFEVDTTDGHATLLSQYPGHALFTSLTIPNNGLHSPDDIQDFVVRPTEPGSEDVSLTFTAPATTYGQQPYGEDARFYFHPIFDGRDYYDIMIAAGALSPDHFLVAPGQRFAGVFHLAAGATHKVSLFVEDATTGERSQTVETSLYVGFDTPCAPSGVTLAYNEERTEATITWEAPTVGIHGGDIDLANMDYIVSRYSDNGTVETDVAFGYRDLSFTDHVNTPMSYTRYGVIARVPEQISEPARTPYAVLGQPRELPFTSTFSYIGEFHQFIVIDANGDGYDDWGTPSWYFDSTYGAAFCYLNRTDAQDDWLVTPALQLEEGEWYEVIFQAYGYYGYAAHLQLAVGPLADAAQLQRTIYDGQFSVPMPKSFPYESSDVQTERVVFQAQEGERYVGFHNIGATNDHLSLDNIYIRKADMSGVGSVLRPAENANSYDLLGRPAHGNTLQIVGGKKILK